MKAKTDELPRAVESLLDGSRLSDKVGHTFVLTATAPGDWPHLALLSAGEVLAVSPVELRLMLYGASGTTRALSATGRGLLMVVLDGVTYKIRIAATPLHEADAGGLRAFVGWVEQCDQDVVGYAEVRHGIEFALVDAPQVLERWEDQLVRLRSARA